MLKKQLEFKPFVYALKVKEKNQDNEYYEEKQNFLLHKKWFDKLPFELQEILLIINQQDWSFGFEFDTNLEILEAEINAFLDEGFYKVNEDEKEYLLDFLDFSRTSTLDKLKDFKTSLTA